MNYTCPMNFEWDEAKSAACFKQRGFDFAYAARAFFDPNRTMHADTRHSYGEERYQLMGVIERRLFVVVYTPRPDLPYAHISTAPSPRRKPGSRRAEAMDFGTVFGKKSQDIQGKSMFCGPRPLDSGLRRNDGRDVCIR